MCVFQNEVLKGTDGISPRKWTSHWEINLKTKICAVDLILYVNLKFMEFGKKTFDVVIIHPEPK